MKSLSQAQTPALKILSPRANASFSIYRNPWVSNLYRIVYSLSCSSPHHDPSISIGTSINVEWFLTYACIGANTFTPRKCVSFPFWWFARMAICTRNALITPLPSTTACTIVRGGYQLKLGSVKCGNRVVTFSQNRQCWWLANLVVRGGQRLWLQLGRRDLFLLRWRLWREYTIRRAWNLGIDKSTTLIRPVTLGKRTRIWTRLGKRMLSLWGCGPSDLSIRITLG